MVSAGARIRSAPDYKAGLHVCRHNLFLEQEFQAVGRQLEQSEAGDHVAQYRDVADARHTRAVGPHPALNPAGNFRAPRAHRARTAT